MTNEDKPKKYNIKLHPNEYLYDDEYQVTKYQDDEANMCDENQEKEVLDDDENFVHTIQSYIATGKTVIQTSMEYSE